MRLGWFLVGLCLWGLSLHTQANQSTLLVVGDSLSAAYGIPLERGWVHLLQQRLQKRSSAWRVVNASISGETTAGGLARLPRLLRVHAPDVVIIPLGANDGLRGLPFQVMERNLGEMIGLARQAGARVLLAGVRLPPNWGPRYNQGFEAVYARVAETQGVAWVPYLLKGVAEDFSLMQADGLHPKAEAQGRILANVWSGLAPLL